MYICTHSRCVGVCGTGVCQKHRARNTPHASACGVYNVASVAIDFIRMGCTTIKSSWP